jgi:hypothetical protein
MNRHDNTMTPARKLVGLTLVAAMGAALGCSSSGGSPTPGTGGKGGSTGTAGTTGTGGTGTGGSTGGSTGGTGGSATGTGGSTGGTGGTATGTGGTGGTGTGGSGTGGSAGTGTGGTGGTAAGGTGGTGGSAGTGGLNLPPTLNVPFGGTLKMHLHAVGNQIYTCTPSSTGGAAGSGAGGAGGAGVTYSFVLKQPDAKLYDETNTQVATHGAGPNWTSTVDSSVVVGAKVYQENSPTSGNIPWLLLHATSHTGTGVFSDVQYVQRVNTAGGVAPATGCDATTANTDTPVSYMADYYFYSGGGPGTDWMTPPGSLPTAIQVPSGATLKLHDHAIGAQVYTCTPSSTGGAGGSGAGGAGGSGATTYSWVLKQPDAVLYDSSFAMVGTHGLGPNWTSTVDGSVVNGMKVAGVNSTATGAIQWLLLQASSNTGTGAFSDVSYVQRLNTAGGVAPATGCDATTSGTDTRIPYSADYYFFTGGLSDGGTNG